MKNTILNPLEQRNELTNKIYEYLINNALGYEKRVKSAIIMKEFNITDNKAFRDYIKKIRDEYNLIICSEAGKKGGYWVGTNQDEVYSTLSHLYKRAMRILKTYSKIKNKAKLDGQYTLKLEEYQNELIEEVNSIFKK
jgi:hypothetical protein